MPKRLLALAQLTSAVGDGAYLVSSVLYFTLIVGLSPVQIGFGLTVGWAVGAVAGVPLGHLADRLGPRGIAIGLAVTTSIAVGSFLFVRSFAAFVIAAVAYATAQGGLAAARQALLAGLVAPEERTKVRAYLQAMVNAGLGLGAALGGGALYLGTKEAFLSVFALDAICFLAAAFLLTRLPAPAVVAATSGPRLAVLRDRPYAVITLLNTVLLLYMPLLSLVVPLWIVQRTNAPHWMVSALLVLNTLSVVLFQVRVARRVTGLASASRLLRHSGAIMLASCSVFALSAIGTSAWAAGLILLAAALLQVMGEMMQASAAWEISFGLAPADKQGQYQGFFGGTGTAVARMLGPLLLTALIIGWGTAGWLVLGGLFLAASLAMTPAVRWAERRVTLAASSSSKGHPHAAPPPASRRVVALGARIGSGGEPHH